MLILSFVGIILIAILIVIAINLKKPSYRVLIPQTLLPNSCSGIYFSNLMLSNFRFDFKKSTTSHQKSCQKTIKW